MTITERHKTYLFYCLLIMPLIAREASAQGSASARIMSLGGEAVSGVIPDYLTDLSLNPAYAAFAGELTINYGYRTAPTFETPYPYMENLSYPPVILRETVYHSNELTVYGIKLSDWRFALSTEWHLLEVDDTETYTSYYNNLPYAYTERNYQDVSQQDNDYWRIDLACARRIGDEYSLGFRAGALGQYKTHLDGDRDIEMSCSFDNFPYEISSCRNWIMNNKYEETGRQVSLFLQIGLLRTDGHDGMHSINARVSKRDISSRFNQYRVNVSKFLDPDLNTTRYHYELTEWRDRRGGDLWAYDLWGRYTFPVGVRLLLGGGFATSSYETDWIDTNETLDWDIEPPYTSEEAIRSRTFSGDGTFRRISFFTKAGKTINIKGKLDLTVGLYAFFKRSWSDENPVMVSTVEKTTQLDHVVFRTDQPIEIDSEVTVFNSSFPLSFDFRVSSYFSCFSGFVLDVTYEKTSNEIAGTMFDELPETNGLSRVPLTSAYTFYSSPSSVFNIGGEGERRITATPSAAIGFSLHYKDRLFIDVYSGSDLTPDSITNMIVDARYTF